MDYTVEYYEKDDGSRPAEEFILSQDNKMQAKIFAALELGRRVILTNGFVKKTVKTPPREIERAKRYRADFNRTGEV